MKINEMQIPLAEKLAKKTELIAFAKEMFEDRLGLNLEEVMHTRFLVARDMNAKLSISMASMDKRLNLTAEEHIKMAELLENIV